MMSSLVLITLVVVAAAAVVVVVVDGAAARVGVVSSLSSLDDGDGLTINTRYGPIRGAVVNGVRTWFGVPFAAPPVGKLRFAPPAAPSRWTSVLSTTTHASQCPQNDVDGYYQGDEDCLYLDVYAPLNATNAPVQVWIYGGSFVNGNSYEDGLYDATRMVKEYGVVHVAGNYRLGALGFYALPELARRDGSTGNAAMLDQVAVLEWVRDNVERFGGDASSVHLFGESAGAISVCWHLASKLSAGLFHSATMESGNCGNVNEFKPLDVALDFGETYAAELGCDDPETRLACLLALPAGSVLDEGVLSRRRRRRRSVGKTFTSSSPFAPVTGGLPSAMTKPPSVLLREGNFNKVPTMLGTNENEGDLFVIMAPLETHECFFPIFTDECVDVFLDAIFNATTVTAIKTRYDQTLTNIELLSHVLRDFFFVCDARRTATSLATAGVPTFMYHFTFQPGWLDTRVLGEYHSTELYFVYGNAVPAALHPFDARTREMSDRMMSYWESFVRTHNPNAGNARLGNIEWPRYDVGARRNVKLDAPLSIESDYSEDVCLFWNTIMPIGQSWM